MTRALDPTCPACRETLDEGAILDRADGNTRRAGFWVPGRAAPGVFVDAKIPSDAYHERLVVRAYRCPRCGRLELYAVDGPADL